MMRTIFNDENEPFWRSAKQLELGVIRPDLFAPFIAEALSRRRQADRRRGRPRSILEEDRRPPVRDAGALLLHLGGGRPGRDGGRRSTFASVSAASCDPSTRTSRSSGKARPRGQRLLVAALAAEPAPVPRLPPAAPPAAGDERAEGAGRARRGASWSRSARTAPMRSSSRSSPSGSRGRSRAPASADQRSSAIRAAARAAPSVSTGR